MADPQPMLLQRHWERTLMDMMDRTEKFPRSARFTFSTRMDNLGLDIAERLIQAHYAPRPKTGGYLAEADRHLMRLRVLVRLAHQRKHLSHGGYEVVAKNMDEAGRMLGGWRQSVEGRA